MKCRLERIQRETNNAAADDRRRWDQAKKVRKKRANVRLDEFVPIVQENDTQEAVAA